MQNIQSGKTSYFYLKSMRPRKMSLANLRNGIISSKQLNPTAYYYLHSSLCLGNDRRNILASVPHVMINGSTLDETKMTLHIELVNR